MKRYRLLKDTPVAPKGEIFEVYDTGLGSEYLRLPGCSIINPVGFQKTSIINFNNWFEEVKEFEEWNPVVNQQYLYLDEAGEVSRTIREDNCEIDDFNISIGNYYPIDTLEETIIKERNLIPQAMHKLKMAAKKAWNEFNGSDGPDWSDGCQEKWKLSYDHQYATFLCTQNRIEQFGSLPCFPAEESAQWAVDNLQDELKLVMGIKD